MHHLALCILPTRPAPYVCLCRGDHRSLRLAEVRHLAPESNWNRHAHRPCYCERTRFRTHAAADTPVF
jgi:hypothetical protein